jgi:signal transduction histidine kinase
MPSATDTRRLVRIAEAASRIAGGDASQPPVDDDGEDEIGALARAFNRMVTELNRVSAENAQLVATEHERLEDLVSDRTRALAQSREMFRLVAESTHAIPFSLDLTSGAFPYIGAVAIANSGASESAWQRPGALDVFLPRDKNHELRRHFDECRHGPFEFVTPVTPSNGRRAEMRWTGTCEHVSGVKILRGLMLDITEFRRMGRELAAAQKLESVGRLAAGVAHEINTPVQFVSDNAQFLRSSIADIVVVLDAYRHLQRVAQSVGNSVGDPASADLEAAVRRATEAEKSVDLNFIMENAPMAIDSSIEGLGRIATIVRSMKEFAHPDQAQKTIADLNQAIRSTLVIARNEYRYVAEIDVEYGDLPQVECHLGEINQVLLNLLVNAAHAIGDVVKDGGALGTITIRTRVDGDRVEISIGDTGTGIPEAVRDKIFDPFFTTKEVGKGTGQGLALAHGVIVNKHGGTLRFATQMGKGTTFFIGLPIEAPDEAETPQQAAA